MFAIVLDDVVIVEDSASGRYVTEVGGDGDGDGDGDKYDDEVVWHFRPEPLNLRLSPLRTSRLLKVKLIPQEASSTGAGPEILMRTVLPGTDIAVFRHRDTRLLSHIHLTVEINATTNFAELKQLHHLVGNTTPTTTAVEVRVAQVLEEVQRQLWLGCSAEEVLLVTDLLHLPCALRINNKDYGSSEVQIQFIICGM